MRFSAAFLPLPLPDMAEALLRRVARKMEPVAPASPSVPERELPQELDQRVRELGEW